jgi:hypothetical protein
MAKLLVTALKMMPTAAPDKRARGAAREIVDLASADC